MANSDYILVKDKEGKMKYFKDGKYFEIEEIDNPRPVTPVTSAPVAASVASPVPSPVDEKIETATTNVITDLKITFTDPSIEKKFRNLVASRLREVRGDKEVKYFLTVPKEEGGFGLAEKPAEAVLLVIKKYEAGLRTVAEPIDEPKVNPPAPEVKPPVLSPVADIITPEAPLPATPTNQNELNAAFDRLFTTIDEKPLEIKPVVSPIAEPAAPVAPLVRPVVKVESANTLDEVKWTPKLVGPVEELGTMDLVSFRRLGATPQDNLAAIKAKINNLSSESWTSGVNGIRAWRNSPVYMIYTAMGVESILSNLPVSQVIVNRQVKNLPALTSNEFIAINEFNHTLEM